MSIEPLKKVLTVLTDLKASMHDAANTSAIEVLDEAIELIQECIEENDNSPESWFAVLTLLGKVFEKLPSIAALLQLLR